MSPDMYLGDATGFGSFKSLTATSPALTYYPYRLG